jgi:biopolymer transport protein ExbB
MQSFSFMEMWANMGAPARAVVIVLAMMSVYSLGVMAERLVTFVRAKRRSEHVAKGVVERLKEQSIMAAMAFAAKKGQSPVARIASAALDEYADILRETSAHADFDVVEAVTREIERVKERETADLKRGLGGLATVASAAPFVGLFGTVVGIINAFQSMAASGQGGLAAVSGGIAEALVTTAFGLLVAIPAVMIYNYLTNRVEDFVVDMNDVSSQLLSVVLKGGGTLEARR